MPNVAAIVLAALALPSCAATTLKRGTITHRDGRVEEYAEFTTKGSFGNAATKDLKDPSPAPNFPGPPVARSLTAATSRPTVALGGGVELNFDQLQHVDYVQAQGIAVGKMVDTTALAIVSGIGIKAWESTQNADTAASLRKEEAKLMAETSQTNTATNAAAKTERIRIRE